jgi:hypothetical protein
MGIQEFPDGKLLWIGLYFDPFDNDGKNDLSEKEEVSKISAFKEQYRDLSETDRLNMIRAVLIPNS